MMLKKVCRQGLQTSFAVFLTFSSISPGISQGTPTPANLLAPQTNSGAPQFDGPAELPRVFINNSFAHSPAPGRTRQVKAGSDLQNALKDAQCGDTLELQAGATFTGELTLPAKSCDDNHWIIIRTSAPDSALPPEGTRLTPCYAGFSSLPGRPRLHCTSTQDVVATLMAVKAGGPITIASGANHYRLGPGLEITRPEGTGINYGLIIKPGNTPADHIIVDRDWVHGTARDETTRGIYLSGVVYAAVVDSYFNDFHCTAGMGACVDSQAIAGGLGDLPQGSWKISNNFLEAAAETILFGGGAGTTIPTDIEIRQNYMYKPLMWMPGRPDFLGAQDTPKPGCPRWDPNGGGQCPFIVKNLFELKNAQRVLFEGNVLEYTWPGFTQHGAAILLTAMSQGGRTGTPNATVADITVRYNRISHAASGLVMGIVGVGQTTWAIPKFAGRFSIHDDIFDDLSPAYANGDTSLPTGLAFQLNQCAQCAPLQDVKIDHLTMILQSPRTFMILGAPDDQPIRKVTFTNNIVTVPLGSAVTGMGHGAPCAFHGQSAEQRIGSCIVSLDFQKNVLIGGADRWPRGNFVFKDIRAAQLAPAQEGNGPDYRLLPGSPYKRGGTDGKDLGADVDAVERATTGVT